MAGTKFILDKRCAVDSNRPAVLKIQIAHRHKTALISLDAKLLPSQWDDVKKMVVKHPNKLMLNAYIGKIKSFVDSLIVRLTNEGVINSMSASDIKQRCTEELQPEKKKVDKSLFLYRFDQYAERTKKGTHRTFDHTRNRLVAFAGEDALAKLRFEDITHQWLQDFDLFLSKNSSKNTRNIHYRNMRTVFNAAIDDELTTHYPFRRFKIKNEVTAKRDLSVEELRLLFFYNCEEHAKRYLDFFKLSFFLCGVNCVDICNLKHEDVERGRLQFHRTKTGHFYSMKVEPETQVLLDKYQGKEWLVDVLEHWKKDEDFRKKMNKVLKKIGPVTICGQGGKKQYNPFFPKVTSYYARHTWATLAYDLDAANETIAQGLGHEYGNRTTNIYIHRNMKKVDALNRKVIDWVLYGKIDGNVVVEPGTPEFFGLDKKKAAQLGLLKADPAEPQNED